MIQRAKSPQVIKREYANLDRAADCKVTIMKTPDPPLRVQGFLIPLFRMQVLPGCRRNSIGHLNRGLDLRLADSRSQIPICSSCFEVSSDVAEVSQLFDQTSVDAAESPQQSGGHRFRTEPKAAA
jgi:hypothetical protein